MCGIAGQLRFDGRPPDLELVGRMTRTLAHRGPDGQGFFDDRRIAMGHRRLALLDPDGPGQPIGDEASGLWLVGNHQIYNHAELRREIEARGRPLRTRGDAEVVLRLFEDLREGAFGKLVGMFALALWDSREEELFLARDPFGIKPLHFAPQGGGVLFASELGAILCDASIDRTIDPGALDGYLRTLTVPEPRTILRAVHKVAPGTWVRVRRTGIQCHRYFELDVGGDWARCGDVASATRSMRRRIDETVALALRSDREVGCFLSGGLDSSALVAAAARRLGAHRLRTYSLGFDEASFDERQFAREVHEAFGTRHREVRLTRHEGAELAEELVDRLDEPFADSSALPTLALSRRAAVDVRAVLSGEGMDELLGGNVWALPSPGVGGEEVPWDDDPRRVVFTLEELRRLVRPEWLERLADARRSPDAAELALRGLRARDRGDARLALDLATYLPSDLLTKMDRFPMACSLEVRVPYLNAPFARWAAGLPLGLKIRDGERKYLLREAMRGVLPESILTREKRGFAVPLDTWIWRDGRFRELVQDLLRARTTRERGLFDPARIEVLLDEHGRLERWHGHRLWTLAVLEGWMRRWLDHRPSEAPVAVGATR